MRQSRQLALNKLKQAKSGEQNRVAQYKVEESQDLLIDVPEEEYKKMVAERKQNRFIEDDLGLGYDDEGELDLAQEEPDQYSEESQPKPEKPSSQQITKFMKHDVSKVRKLAPKVDKEKRENLRNKLNSMLDDDGVEENDILIMNQDIKKPSVPKTLSKGISEDQMNERYNIPISSLSIKSPVKTSAPIAPDPEIPTKDPSTLFIKERLNILSSKSLASSKTPNQNTKILQETPKPQPPNPIFSTPPSKNKNLEPLMKDEANENYKRKAPGALPEQMPKYDEPIIFIPNNDIKTIDDTNMHIDNEVSIPEPMEIEENTIETLAFESNPDLPIENGSLNMYWIDAIEDRDVYPGGIFIFGKVYLPKSRKFTGICVLVKEIEQSFFILPRPEYKDNPNEVWAELEALRSKFRIGSWGKKPVQRRYAFNFVDVPPLADYYKYTYSSKFPQADIRPGKTFSHVFGAKTSLIETVLVKRKLKGPCWIKLNNIMQSKTKFSNCLIEVVIPNHRSINFGIEEANMNIPPLVMMSFAIISKPNRKSEHEIWALSGCIHNQVDQVGHTDESKYHMAYFSLVNNGQRAKKSGVYETFPNEKAVLNAFIDKVSQCDPDILAGHDLLSDTLVKVCERLKVLGVSNWSHIGRLQRNKFPFSKRNDYYSGNWIIRACTGGRLLLDTLMSSKELAREKIYDLGSLAKSWFGITRNEIDFDIEEAKTNSDKAYRLGYVAKQDSELIHKIVCHLNVIPLTKQLTNIAGNLWVRSLQSQRAERNEMLLIHEFHKKKYIIPDKAEKKFEEKSEKKKNQYSGGLVLSPIAGLYDKFVILLDFNSLYPSIIREYNICFTTISHAGLEDKDIDTADLDTKKKGTLPEIIAELVTKRRQVKAQIKAERDKLKLKQLDIKQIALKLTANSMYGCLGFTQSRFYARPIAAFITSMGRKTLERTVAIAKDSLSLEVIYGDTDSIMIHTGQTEITEAIKIGNDLKRLVNKQFKHLEIELDGVFQSMLLLKKKKYAALKIVDGVTKREVKGLDMVRRDWCELSKRVSSDVLNLILSNYNKEQISEQIKAYIEQFYTKINDNTLSSYIIYKQLTKTVDKYKDAASQPHVQVAKRLIAKGETNLLNHIIPYVVCEGDEPNIASRSYHPEEVASSVGVLKPDIRWYIIQQIIPPLQRLIAPIDIIKIEEIVEIMGEDPNKFKSQVKDFEIKTIYTGTPIMCYCVIREHKAFDIKANIEEKNKISYIYCPECKKNDTQKQPGDKNKQTIMEGKIVKNALIRFLKQKMMQVYTTDYKCANCNSITKLKKNEQCKICLENKCQSMMKPLHSFREFNFDLKTVYDIESTLLTELTLFNRSLFSKKLLEKNNYSKFSTIPYVSEVPNYNKLLIH